MLFHPSKTKEIKEGIYAVNAGIVNFYLIDTGESFIAFDTGVNPLLTKRGLEKLGITPEKISQVFLTHSDYDHAGGLKVFKNAQIYISAREEPMVTGRKTRLLFMKNKRIPHYRTLEDRQVVRVGRCKIQIISTPGHTVGSACYLIDEGTLVTGDTLRVTKKGEITPFLLFQNMNHSEDKRSLKLLESEGLLNRPMLILTGHTGIFP